MDMPAAEARERRVRHSALKVLDCDVHPTVSGGMRSIYPYMSEAWARRFERKNASMASLALTTKYQHPNGSAIRAQRGSLQGPVCCLRKGIDGSRGARSTGNDRLPPGGGMRTSAFASHSN